MKIYAVRNFFYTVGYFVNKENADRERDKTNKFIEDHKDHPNLNTTPVYVEEIETLD